MFVFDRSPQVCLMWILILSFVFLFAQTARSHNVSVSPLEIVSRRLSFISKRRRTVLGSGTKRVALQSTSEKGVRPEICGGILLLWIAGLVLSGNLFAHREISTVAATIVEHFSSEFVNTIPERFSLKLVLIEWDQQEGHFNWAVQSSTKKKRVAYILSFYKAHKKAIFW